MMLAVSMARLMLEWMSTVVFTKQEAHLFFKYGQTEAYPAGELASTKVPGNTVCNATNVQGLNPVGYIRNYLFSRVQIQHSISYT